MPVGGTRGDAGGGGASEDRLTLSPSGLTR